MMKLIASWGSSGAGKTTLALALAAALVQRRRDVLVIGMDTRTPMLPVYLPNQTKLDRRSSLGGVFEQEVGEAALKDKMIPHPQSDRLYFMGLTSGELSGISHKIPDRQAVQALFQTLRQSPFSYCIVDCDSSPVLEPLTLTALEEADIVLRAATPDVRGYEAVQAQLRWLKNSEDTFRTGRHIRILNPVAPYTPLAEVQALFGGDLTVLPWAVEVAERQLAGRLLSRMEQPAGLQFERRISALADRMEEGKHD